MRRAGELARELQNYVTGPNDERLYPDASSFLRRRIVEAATLLSAQEEEIERLRAQVKELSKLLNWYRRAALNEGSKRDG